jgi:DNA-binding PadR family transcriptional regulator
MAARGLLAPTAAAAGKRQRLDYQLTEAGRAALEEWLLDARRAAGMGFDPLRSRLVHLHLVSPERRRQFLDEVRVLSAEFAERPAFTDQPLSRQIHASWLKARAAWLAMLDFVAR